MNNIIELNDVWVMYGTHRVLCQVSLSFAEGQFISIIGPNGGGKSTLIKLILGLQQPTKGAVSVYGHNPATLPAKTFGYVPQIKTADRSFPALPLELVASGVTASWTGRFTPELKKISMDALARVGADHLASRPLGKLSGGELQRVYLARSIVRQPKIMLLDEPATGIDTSAENDLNHMIDDLRKDINSTIIHVTHDWESAYYHSDSVLILDRQVICHDKPDKAFNEESLRKAFGHIGHAHEMFFGARK